MARSGCTRSAEESRRVTFSIELRPASYEQVEAGKRLFSRLIDRAERASDEGARSPRAARRRRPPAESRSLTNRGTLSSKEEGECEL